MAPNELHGSVTGPPAYFAPAALTLPVDFIYACHQVLDELCGGDVADAVRAGGTHGLPEPTKAALQQETMLVCAACLCIAAVAGHVLPHIKSCP